ncbi:MAG: LptF/LptG family permease [Bacteroidetes bacterium]|nr:LptF/LptG family permease [Bacteroidota bacterium]
MKNLLPVLDRYILRKFMVTFFGSISMLISIVIVFDISEKIEDFLRHDVSANEIVFDYYLNFIPYFINLFSPLFTFISVIFFTSLMATRTEVVAILTSGISFNRYLRPYMIGAAIIAITSLLLGMFVIPQANKTRLGFEAKYVGGRTSSVKNNFYRQVAPGVIAYVERYDLFENTGTRFTLEKIKGQELTYKLYAKEIRWDTLRRRWSIRDYTVREIKGKTERFYKGARIDTVLNLTPEDFDMPNNFMESMTQPELLRYINNERMKGSENILYYELEYYNRFALPFSTFILTLIGVAVSSRKERGGTGKHLGIGIAISFIYIFFQRWFQSYAQSGVIPPYVSVWIPNVVFLGVCLYLLKRAPK